MKKKTMKRNQIIIGALTVLLGVAGYINFSGNSLNLASGEKEQTESAFAGDDKTIGTPLDSQVAVMDTVSAGEVEVAEMGGDEYIELNSAEEHIGEAVLASANTGASNFVNIKLNREQNRSQNKETLLEIINGDSMDEAAVQSATDAYIKLTENAEKEQEAESILAAKGFGDVIVSISDGSVDVVVNKAELSDTERAQIEDVIVRKTGCSIEEVVITLAQ